MSVQQEIFDKIVAHLRKQKARSTSGTRCMYRSFDGLKCAVGCLIPDENYTQKLEKQLPGSKDVKEALPERYRNETYILTEMQVIHDHSKVSEWEAKFKDFAYVNKLVYKEPETCEQNSKSLTS